MHAAPPRAASLVVGASFTAAARGIFRFSKVRQCARPPRAAFLVGSTSFPAAARRMVSQDRVAHRRQVRLLSLLAHRSLRRQGECFGFPRFVDAHRFHVRLLSLLAHRSRQRQGEYLASPRRQGEIRGFPRAVAERCHRGSAKSSRDPAKLVVSLAYYAKGYNAGTKPSPTATSVKIVARKPSFKKF